MYLRKGVESLSVLVSRGTGPAYSSEYLIFYYYDGIVVVIVVVVGFLGWVLCAPLMVLGLCMRDKPDPHDDEEWRDDPCLPCYYDDDFRYSD